MTGKDLYITTQGALRRESTSDDTKQFGRFDVNAWRQEMLHQYAALPQDVRDQYDALAEDVSENNRALQRPFDGPPSAIQRAASVA